MVGMTNNAIERAGKLLDSPLANIVANAFGTDINKARMALAKLTGQPKHNSSGDDLARLRAGLQQLKG